MSEPWSVIAAIFFYAYAGELSVLLVQSWRRTRHCFDGFPFRASWQLLRLLRLTKGELWYFLAALVSIPMVVVYGFFFRPVLSQPLIAFGLAMLVQGVFLSFKALQPPIALFLGRSSPYAVNLLVEINQAVSPLRCVALLDSKQMSFVQRNALGENLRTKDPRLWLGVVHRLVEMTPVILCDTRVTTEALIQEILSLLEPMHARRTVFVTDEAGRAPALEFLGIDPRDHALTCITEDELIPLLRYLARSPHTVQELLNRGGDVKGFREWFRRARLRRIASRLPEHWESVRSFTVVIPFSEADLPQLEQTLFQAVKIRQILREVHCAKYFPDDVYSGICALRQGGESVEPGSDLDHYAETFEHEAEEMVAEKVRLMLLYEDWARPLGERQQASVNALASRHPSCDVLDFVDAPPPGGMHPRRAVSLLGAVGPVVFLEPGSHLSEDRAADILIRNASRVAPPVEAEVKRIK